LEGRMSRESWDNLRDVVLPPILGEATKQSKMFQMMSCATVAIGFILFAVGGFVMTSPSTEYDDDDDHDVFNPAGLAVGILGFVMFGGGGLGATQASRMRETAKHQVIQTITDHPEVRQIMEHHPGVQLQAFAGLLVSAGGRNRGFVMQTRVSVAVILDGGVGAPPAQPTQVVYTAQPVSAYGMQPAAPGYPAAVDPTTLPASRDCCSIPAAQQAGHGLGLEKGAEPAPPPPPAEGPEWVRTTDPASGREYEYLPGTNSVRWIS